MKTTLTGLLGRVAVTGLLTAGCIFRLPANTFSTVTSNVTATDSVAMTREADDFLYEMPEGLQDRQRQVIDHALRGDGGELAGIRSSRNKPFIGSESVTATDIVIPVAIASGSVSTSSVRARLYRPKDVSGPLPLLIYLHGGGWTIGSINSCAKFCDAIAATGKVAVLAPEYSLAPEHPLPEALIETMGVFRYAVKNADSFGTTPELVSLGGDSSGGNLALSVAAAITDGKVNQEGDMAPRSLLLFYPVTRAYTDGSESWRRYGKGYGLDSRLMESFNEAYLSGQLEESVFSTEEMMLLTSPGDLNAERLASLPPTLLIAAEHDILADQGEDLIEKMKRAGAKAERKVYPGTVHLFITVDGQPTAFRTAVTDAAAFLGK